MRSRLSVCYAAPGHSLLNTSGSTRNILSLAQALSQWADVTVAFRRILEPIRAERFKVVAIEPHVEESADIEDDDATKGVNPFTHLSYLRTLRSFSKKGEGSCDVVLEKGWRLSGYLLDAFRRKGVPGALIENDIRFWNEPLHDLRTIAKYALHSTAQCVAGTCSRHAPVVVAETEELKTLLIEHRRVPPERIEVVELGVDHTLFRPMDQASARNSLGISPDATVLLYVGGMDKYHDLGPIIEALSQMESSAVQLHLVGDGEHRTRYEEKANQTPKGITFHGRVPHHKVPEYIAASDLCIAPYCIHAFHNGIVTFSTLKIPEYMACGRPAVSIPSGPVQRLIKDHLSGFLFPNDVPSWLSFFKALPSRDRLQEMGQAAACAVASRSWEKTAAQYFEVCQRLSGSERSLTQ
jgi:glycosyltransferase involved in cell wall biosynthesis